MLKDFVQSVSQATDNNIICYMRFACWITYGYILILGMYSTYCFSTATVVTRTRLNVTFMRTSPVMLTACRRRLVLSHGERFASTLNADSSLGRRVFNTDKCSLVRRRVDDGRSSFLAELWSVLKFCPHPFLKVFHEKLRWNFACQCIHCARRLISDQLRSLRRWFVTPYLTLTWIHARFF